MTDKGPTEASADDMQEISPEEITKNLKDISGANVAVWRRNRENQLVVVPAAKLEQYIGEKTGEAQKFFIERNWKDRIKNYESVLREKQTAQGSASGDGRGTAVKPEEAMKEVKKFGQVEEQLSVFRSMPVFEREEILDECITKLSEDTAQKLDVGLIVRMVDVLSKSLYANSADLEDSVSTVNVKDNIYGVLVKSNWIIQILINLFDQKKYPYNDLNVIDLISTGSKTIDHINKVFLRFLTFCIFFNEYIGEGLITKNIRGAYKDRYHRYYRKRFPDMDITIEKIFKNGIRRIDREKELQDYVLGALLFDMGKLSDIKYHDSDEKYDNEIVKKHALNSFNMVTKAKQYPFSVMAMSVFHHEYYGGKGSYNFTRPLLSRFTGKKITEDNVKYFISYDKEDFINGISLSYFPCKVIEMLDIYDALIYKKNNPPLEALRTMKKEFITKSLKIDPVLFRIFLEYNVRCASIKPEEMEEIDAIIL